MPFDLQQGSDLYPKTDNEHKSVVSRRIRWLTEGIPSLRELKAENGDIGQFKGFELGQRVWKRESKYDGKGYAPVFAPRRTGPFVIHSVWDKNVYKLRTDPVVTGKRVGYLNNSINGSRLKAYVEGEVVN